VAFGFSNELLEIVVACAVFFENSSRQNKPARAIIADRCYNPCDLLLMLALRTASLIATRARLFDLENSVTAEEQ